jgi:hypothetical protein
MTPIVGRKSRDSLATTLTGLEDREMEDRARGDFAKTQEEDMHTDARSRRTQNRATESILKTPCLERMTREQTPTHAAPHPVSRRFSDRRLRHGHPGDAHLRTLAAKNTDE